MIRAKGSLSVFFALIMVAVMTLLFTMSECIRIYELHELAQEYTDMAVESAFSEYNPYLWSNYKILAIDLGYGTDSTGPGILEQKTLDYCKYNSNVESGHNYARLMAESCVANQYALLTDEKGQGVITLGARAAKDDLAAQVVDGIQGHVDSINNIEKVPVEEKAKKGKSTLADAKKAREEAIQAAESDDDPNTNASDYPEPEEVEDDPLEAFDLLKECMSKSVLSMVTDAEKLSDEKIGLEKAPSHRSLNTGTMKLTDGNNIVDKALFIDYVLSNYEYFGKDKKHDGLHYEVEYLLSGNGSDAQCLSSVVGQIMLVREAANFATISGSVAMKAQAKEIAVIIAGFTANPIIIEAVQYGIMAAWAYAESILDVRQILSGGKISAVKNVDEWTSDVWHLSQVANVKFKAKASKTGGIGYKEYLMAFLALRTNNTLSMRALDVMENALNATEDYAEVKVDNMMWAADMEIDYSAKEMFLSIFPEILQEDELGQYCIEKSRCMTY